MSLMNPIEDGGGGGFGPTGGGVGPSGGGGGGGIGGGGIATPGSGLIEASAQLGISKPLAYGYIRAVGNQVFQHKLSDGTVYALIMLGEGEWTAVDRFWINRKLVDPSTTSFLHFHAGTEPALGSGLAATSTGGDQQVDAFFTNVPANAYRVTYSGLAYIFLKAPPDPSAPGPDLEWIGEYRGCKVRTFDAAGNQTSYGFSTNPAWIILDVIIRCALKREGLKAAALTAAEKTRIDFASFVTAAAWFDVLVDGTNKRSEISVAFTEKTSLSNALQQLNMMSRSFLLEYDGKIHLQVDDQRSHCFTLTKDNILPGTFKPSKKNLRGMANRFIGKFNDLNPLKNVDITSCQRTTNVVTVITATTHPYVTNDNVTQWGTSGAAFDGTFVITVVNGTTYTFPQTGANTAALGGGSAGTAESRFMVKAKVLDHEQHQLAVGQRGVGVTATYKRNLVELDFGNSTGERVERMLKYLKRRTLGAEATPYAAPWSLNVTVPRNAIGSKLFGPPSMYQGPNIAGGVAAGTYDCIVAVLNGSVVSDLTAMGSVTLSAIRPLNFNYIFGAPSYPLEHDRELDGTYVRVYIRYNGGAWFYKDELLNIGVGPPGYMAATLPSIAGNPPAVPCSIAKDLLPGDFVIVDKSASEELVGKRFEIIDTTAGSEDNEYSLELNMLEVVNSAFNDVADVGNVTVPGVRSGHLAGVVT